MSVKILSDFCRHYYRYFILYNKRYVLYCWYIEDMTVSASLI